MLCSEARRNHPPEMGKSGTNCEKDRLMRAAVRSSWGLVDDVPNVWQSLTFGWGGKKTAHPHFDGKFKLFSNGFDC